MRAVTDSGTAHIVHVVHRLDVGGLENGVVNLVNRMPAERFRSAIVCVAGYGDEFRRRISREDVKVLSLNKRTGKDLPMYGRMWRALRRLRPDVVHTRNFGTVDLQWIAAAAGVPVRVHGEHGWEASDPRGLDPKRLRIRRACRPVIHRYVPMSQDIAAWLVRDIGVPQGRINQLYSGVDTEHFHPDGPLPADMPWRNEPRRVVVGTVGRLDPVKNQASLLQAVGSIARNDPVLGSSLRVVIAGDGVLRDDLRRVAYDVGLADRVWFAGSRSDTPDIMRALDVFVLPSINEGVSNTILEAMATRLPVVAARVGGNPEVVTDGVTGLLYQENGSAGVELALLTYLKDAALRRQHGQAGRDRALAEFSLEAMVDGYMALYDQLLGRPRN